MSIRNKIQEAYLKSVFFKKVVLIDSVILGAKEYDELAEELKSMQRFGEPSDADGRLKIIINLFEGSRDVHRVVKVKRNAGQRNYFR